MDENKNKQESATFASLETLAARWKDGTFREIIDDWKWIFTYSARYKFAIVFYVFLGIAIVGMAFLYLVAKMEQPSMMLVYIAQFVKSTGVIVATGYMWALVPEVISYGEYKSGKRIAGIVNALTGIFFKAGMTLGSVVAPAILAYVAYNPKTVEQTPEAQEGILWLVCVIPAALLLLAIFIISKYELTDAVIDDINKKIEARHKQEK